MEKLCFFICGGDERQRYIAKLLREDGHEVYTYGLENNDEADLEIKARADYVILPFQGKTKKGTINMPFSESILRFDELISHIAPPTKILAGMVTSGLRELCDAKNIAILDYFESEEMKLRNAIPTCEGTIAIVVQNITHTIHGSNCLIIGYGRIGKVLVKTLRNMGAHVTIAARSPNEVEGAAAFGVAYVADEANGATYVHTNALSKVDEATAFDVAYAHTDELTDAVSHKHIIINTVPALLITEEVLRHIDKSALIIDLSSSPGGVDFDVAKSLGINARWEQSIPGRFFPQTAGRIILETVYSML